MNEILKLAFSIILSGCAISAPKTEINMFLSANSLDPSIVYEQTNLVRSGNTIFAQYQSTNTSHVIEKNLRIEPGNIQLLTSDNITTIFEEYVFKESDSEGLATIVASVLYPGFFTAKDLENLPVTCKNTNWYGNLDERSGFIYKYKVIGPVVVIMSEVIEGEIVWNVQEFSCSAQ